MEYAFLFLLRARQSLGIAGCQEFDMNIDSGTEYMYCFNVQNSRAHNLDAFLIPGQERGQLIHHLRGLQNF